MQTLKHPFFISVSMILVACGGGSSNPIVTTLSGSVIDGYIGGAIVCLDTNSNQKCDGPSIDPQTTTKADGSYTFTYTGDVSGMHVIAEVPVGATDSDLGTISKPYSLLAPAEASTKTAPVVITPLTTLVSSEMISSKSTAVDAEKSVKANLGLTTALVGYDFKKANDTSTTAVAQVTAAAIASATAAIKADATVAAAGLSSGEIVKKAVEQVKDNVLSTVLQNGKVTVADSSSQEKVIAQVSSTVTNVIQGKIENIVASTKSGDGTVVDLATVFKTTGIVVANRETGDYIDASGKRVNGNWNGFVDALQIEWIKFDLATATGPGPKTQRVLVGNEWFSKFDNSEDVTFDGTNWVASGFLNQAKPTITGNCMEVPLTKTGAPSQIICATAKDLTGKMIGDLLPNLCKSSDSTIPGCNVKTLFPAGSVAYDMTITAKQDAYTLWPSLDWTGYNTIGTKDIYGFLASLKQYPQWMGGGCNTGFMVASYNDSVTPKAKKGTIKWGTNSSKNACNGAKVDTYTETTNFEIITVGDKELIKLETSNLFRANNGDSRAYTLFGYHQGTKQSGIWNGEFTPASFKQSIKFSGDPKIGPQVISPIFLDAILKQQGQTPYPYPTN